MVVEVQVPTELEARFFDVLWYEFGQSLLVGAVDQLGNLTGQGCGREFRVLTIDWLHCHDVFSNSAAPVAQTVSNSKQ